MPNHFGNFKAISISQYEKLTEAGNYELVIGGLDAFVESFHVYLVLDKRRNTAKCVSHER